MTSIVDKPSRVKCPICSKLRPLQKHLHELAEYCYFLGGSVLYVRGQGKRIVKTSTIGDWLRLASQLEKVSINTWSFSGDEGVYCEPVADKYDSDAEHFSKFSTFLTRMIFASHALEEMYRFVAPHFDALSDSEKPNKPIRDASLKTAYLVDRIKSENFPLDFRHFISNFSESFEIYQKLISPQMSAMEDVQTSDSSYGLHLIRNLRNHISHGIFPIIENPEYLGGDNRTAMLLTQLLGRAVRVTGLYIQLLLIQFGGNFNSDEYRSIDGSEGLAEEFFIENCKPEYCARLHFVGKFGFENWISYDDDTVDDRNDA